MITKIIEIYKCEYCKKIYQIKRFAVQHELRCCKNPDNKRPCFDCPMMVKKEIEIYESFYDGDHERKVDLLYCNYKEQFLYTPKTELKGTAFDLGNESNEPMPKECDVDLNTIDTIHFSKPY